MRRPVEGEVFVHYGQIYVESDPESCGPDLQEAFAGQSAGLCGAAVPGALWLSTGLHTGSVGFTVEVHDQAPPLDERWEDVVEVSFRPASEDSVLMQWAGEDYGELNLAQTHYRVRYSAKGMDEGRRADTRGDDEPECDSYLLQFWPAPPAPDRTLKQTSETAAYAHEHARPLPPPPSPEVRAETERLARLAQAQEEREGRLAYERWDWGGQLPSQALRDVGGNVRGLLPFDPRLVHAIAAAAPAVQRAVALRAARLACEAAGLTELDWIGTALSAASDGGPLPPPFDDPDRVWQVLEADPSAPDRTVGRAVPPERPPFQPTSHDLSGPDQPSQVVGPAAAITPSSTPAERYALMVTFGAPNDDLRRSQPRMALPALLATAEADPLRAALDAVYAAVVTYGPDYGVLLDDVWSVCEGRP